MKKILLVLLLSIMLLPVVVKADQEILNTYSNTYVIIGEDVVVHIPVSFNKEYNLEFTYDESIIKIDNITISQEETSKLIDGKLQKVNNLLETKIESGKVSVKARMDESEGTVTFQGVPEITLTFKAIKVGATKISINGGIDIRFNRIPEVNVKDKDCPVVTENKTTETNDNKEDSKTIEDSKKEENNTTDDKTTTDTIGESKNDEKKETTTEKTECKDNNNILLYCSLAINFLLLIAVIVILLIKKKPKIETKIEE